MLKKLSLFVLMLVMVMAIGTTGIQAEEIEVGYVTGNMGSDINAIAYEAFEKFANEKGWEVNLADCQGDVTKFSPNIRNFVNQDVDAIVVFSSEDKLIKGGAQAAKEAGIPIFLADTENTESTIVNVTSNNWAMGALLGSHIVDRANSMGSGKHKVALIGMPDLYVHRIRMEMVKSVIGSPEHPNVEVVATQAVNSSNWQTESYNIAQTWLSKYGNELDAIVGTWDGINWGIARAINDAGYTKEDMFSMSIDGVSKTINMIREGSPIVGVVAQDFGGWVETLGQAIDKAVVQGEDPESFVPESRTIYVPHKWIDSTNVPEEGEEINFSYEGMN